MVKKPQIDGFVPRRAPGIIGVPQSTAQRPVASGIRRREYSQSNDAETSVSTLAPSAQHGLTRQDVDESLKEIDAQHATTPQKVRHRGSFNGRRRRIIKWGIIALVVAIIAVGVVLMAKALIASSSVFKGDVFGLIQQKKLQQDANGRTNILILGTSEDDPGHQGAHLTDSIMVLSVDQTNKNAYMISIPRDLQVKYGQACNSGYAGKINEYFGCVNDDWTSTSAETERQAASRTFFGDIVGLDIQYSVHVNYTVMRDVVKALDGITVTIESRDPRGQMDSNFDWKCKGGNAYASRATMIKNCPPNGHFIDYPNGPVTLDAEHALYLAQARGDTAPTYGFEQSNFDREKNQQKILVAIKEKAMSSGTLTNLGKVTGLIDALGSNLRTNFETSEIRTLITLGQDIPSTAIDSVNLIDSDIMSGDAQPSAGLYNFTQLQAYIKKKIYATGISKEDSHVIVLNASGVAGAAQVESDKLTALGMTVDATGNAPSNTSVTTNTIYQVGKTAKTKTAEKLAQLYGVTPKVATSVPGVTAGEQTDYILILVTANTSATGNTSAGQ